jgi:hypothetical protein
LLLDGRRLTGVGIFQEKRAPAPLEALPAPIALLALRRRAMPDDIAYGQRLLLDSRVVDVPMAYNPTFVTLSSLKPFFFNGLQNE